MSAFQETYLRTYRDYLSTTITTVHGQSGIGIAFLGTVPQNHCIRVERCLAVGTTGATIRLIVGSQSEQNASEFSAASFDNTRALDFQPVNTTTFSVYFDLHQPAYFDEGEAPGLFWAGATGGALVTGTFQIALFKKIPVLSHYGRQSDMFGDIEREEVREMATVVGGSGWDPVGLIGDSQMARIPGVAPWANDENPSDEPSVYESNEVAQVAGVIRK